MMNSTQNPRYPTVDNLANALHCECVCEEDTIDVRLSIYQTLRRTEAQILEQIQGGRWADTNLVRARAELKALLGEADELLEAIEEEGVY